MSGFENVLVSCGDGVGRITLNRPHKLNAFAGTMRQEIASAVRDMAADDAVRVIVITGAGRAFCAGADVGYMKTLTDAADVDAFRLLVEAGRNVVTTIRATPKPVIASVNGAAAGGGANLALACDFRIASDRAAIGQTFTRVGLMPDWGGTYLLPKLVGSPKALELVFSGEMVPADEALRLGLFDRVVPHEQLARATDDYARSLVDKPPLAIALAKSTIYSSEAHTMQQVLELEQEHQLRCFQSEDAKEGLEAFLEKRTPTFHGR
jgi:enoyl-CoA hydratase/carnithine racemase